MCKNRRNIFFVDSPNYSKIIEVASSPLSAKWLLKGKNHTGHIVPVPDWSEDAVSKSTE